MIFLTRPMSSACLTMALLVAVSSQQVAHQQVFSDEHAAVHIDSLSYRGIQLLLTWRDELIDSLMAINSTLDWVEGHLDTYYGDDDLVNLTAYAFDALQVQFSDTLNTATTMTNDLNLQDDGDGLVAFMTSPDNTINVQGAYNPGNRAGGTFTAPQDGLYHVTVRSSTGSGVAIDLILNGDETLASISAGNTYDIQTRIVLRWLTAGDEIFTTGNEPMFFGVLLLQVQELLPSML